MHNINIIKATWPNLEGIFAGTTVRSKGFSEGVYSRFNLADHVDDDISCVQENRRLLKDTLKLPSEPCWLKQKHEANVLVEPDNNEILIGDASITRLPGKISVVLTADCLPILLANKSQDIVGSIHAGWRGMVAGVIENTISAMQSNVEDIMVWLGPAISQSAFEVGDEVRDIFLNMHLQNEDCFKMNDNKRWQADIYQLARIKFELLGIENIFGGSYCTYRDSDLFYSYRREIKCGRMASMIYIK